MTDKTFFVGVMLDASTNRDNRIQFLLVPRGNGYHDLYSRTRGFGRKWTKATSKYVMSGKRSDLLTHINEARQTMSRRGISVPGTEVFEGRLS